MNLISANQSQQDFSTQQRIFQPSQTWFHSFIFHVNCFAFQRQSGQWSMPGQSRQPDATTWIDKPDLGADSTHRPKKNHVFSEPSSIRFRSQILPVVVAWPSFGSRAFSHQIVGSMLTRAVITRILFYQKAAIISTQSWQFVNISVCRWHGEE